MRKLIPQRRMSVRATSSVTGFRVWLLADESPATYPCAYEDAAVSPGGAALASAFHPAGVQARARARRRGRLSGRFAGDRLSEMRCAPSLAQSPQSWHPAKRGGIPGQEVFPVTRIVPLPARPGGIMGRRGLRAPPSPARGGEGNRVRSRISTGSVRSGFKGIASRSRRLPMLGFVHFFASHGRLPPISLIGKAIGKLSIVLLNSRLFHLYARNGLILCRWVGKLPRAFAVLHPN
jgi:hypothetical protein